MPQTRIFRDRVVSMEQTLEGGEKHLELLKALCREAFSQFDYKEHFLDHERDLFSMVLEAPDGRRKTVSWTRMVLFDVERIPVIAGDPGSGLRSKLLRYLADRANRPEIVVTFRHLEEGWVDSPERRREKKRGRRGRGQERVGALGRPEKPATARARGQPPGREPAASAAATPPPRAERRPPSSPPAARPGEVRPAPGSRRRRFRRRRRGGRGPGSGSPAPTPQPGP